MEETKTKEKGDIHRTGKIIANAIGTLNGTECTKNAKVPIILLDYTSPQSSHPFALGERFALWCKLEDAQFRKFEIQLNRNLKELTLWFDEENKNKLRDFLNDN
ncbi:MAG: hypothetical protein PHO89_07085 [Methylacidiphilaceae bacterium]|nr:hypothetical protein [Candidatus Methylacidiphilaceae bacterium]